MKNRNLPQAHYTEEGQYLLDTEQRRYGALLKFVEVKL